MPGEISPFTTLPPPVLNRSVGAGRDQLEVAPGGAVAALDHGAAVQPPLRPRVGIDVVDARLRPVVDRHLAVADPCIAVIVPA